MIMSGFKGRYGFSFSWRRLLGLTGLRSSIAHRTGVPTTRGGIERKIGRYLLRMLLGRR